MSALVGEVGGKPALGLLQSERLAPGVVGSLVLADLVDREIPGIRVGEIKAAHARGGKHGVRFGEREARLASREQGEQRSLFRVVRTGGIAGRGADAAVFLCDQLGARKSLARGVAPV